MNKQQSLETFLKNVKLPKPVRRKRTFFDISGTSHYELAISNWYAYFFDQEEDHGLGNLFIECLLELVKRKTGKEISLRFFKVQKEVATKGGKRIDILVSGIEEDERKYIIIENKINHWLNNDLDAYWQHCVGAEDSKVGVILSLNRETVPLTVQHKFVNVQHCDIINLVKEKMSTYKQEASYYLNEFITTIENLYTDLTMDEEVKFYFDHVKECSQIYQIRKKTYQFVVNQIKEAANMLALSTDGGDYHRYLFENGRDAYYNIIYDNLLDSKCQITIAIDLYQQGFLQIDKLKQIIDISQMTGLDDISKGKVKGLGWQRFVSKTYSLKTEDLKGLSAFIVEKINNEFSSVLFRLNEEITKDGQRT